MIRDPIVITDGLCMHIPQTRIHHRDYPEVQGEGRSASDAADHLEGRLACGLDFVHGRERAALEQALADVRAARPTRPRPGRGALVRVPSDVLRPGPRACC